RLTGLEAHSIARLGIARTFQASRLCLDLSAFDNILIGMHARRRTGLLDSVVRRGRLVGEMRAAIERASHLLALFNPDLPRRVVAFNYGRKIAEGSFAEVARHTEVRAAYLGTETAHA